MSFWLQSDLTFDEEKHLYLWKGSPVIGVTSVMDRVGVRKDDQSPWNPVGCPDIAKREHDSSFGSAFHKVCSAILNDQIVDYPDTLTPWIVQFRRFIRDNPLVPLCDQNGNKLVEYPMYSVKYRYAGTPDLVAMTAREEVWLLDWKTATSYQKSYGYQTAAYEQLLREVFGIKKKIVRVTVLFSADDYKPYWRVNRPEDFIAFTSFLNTLRMAA